MSTGFIALSIYIFLTLGFYTWYFLTRYKLKKKFFRLSFFGNMIFGILLVLPIPYYALDYYGINNPYLNLSLMLMALAIITHHTSVLLITGKKHRSKLLEFIHIPLSHLMLGIPYVLAGLFGALSFYPHVSSVADMTVFLLWFIETEILGSLAILVGLNKVKLP